MDLRTSSGVQGARLWFTSSRIKVLWATHALGPRWDAKARNGHPDPLEAGVCGCEELSCMVKCQLRALQGCWH